MIDLAQLLKKEGVDLEVENDATGVLGVKMTKTSGGMTVMTQEGLVDRIVEAMGLDGDDSASKSTHMFESIFDQGCGW